MSEVNGAAPDRVAPDRVAPDGVRRRLRRRYYEWKYRLFRRDRRLADGRRGVVVLQIDALSYAELRRAIELGYCPTLSQMVREEGYTLRRWFCGLPSATPYCQAGIMYGQNDGIPAFRFYDRVQQRVITCNAPAGVQYIRDRIQAPGALAGGSSYVNLLDGDARHVALTVATRDRMSVFRRLGGWRMAALLAAHPVRVARMALQAVMEWLREEWERTAGELARRRTHSEGLFPFVRILTNVVVRELQTMGILLDAHIGVPAIYSTFMQYDELAHHFGPSSWQALRDLRRTDKRIGEIKRMLETAAGRPYDLVVLSDHGMTPAASYRVLYGETLGTTVQRILDGDALRAGERRSVLHAVESGSETSEYATVGPQVVEAVVQAQPLRRKRRRRLLRRFRDWLGRAYGLRGLLLPEKYLDDPEREVVVTYSSDLALLYFATALERMELGEIVRERRRAALYQSLLEHPGIGLVAALSGPAVHLESARGRAVLVGGVLEVLSGENPLVPYGIEAPLVKAVERLVRQPNAGDLVIFGAYDGYEIVSFDDQIGAHGAAGGNQLYPFVIAPASMRLDGAVIEDARDLHPLLFRSRSIGTMDPSSESPVASRE